MPKGEGTANRFEALDKRLVDKPASVTRRSILRAQFSTDEDELETEFIQIGKIKPPPPPPPRSVVPGSNIESAALETVTPLDVEEFARVISYPLEMRHNAAPS
ncbi:hypothetical protein GQ600_27563 [Phytophthora cactorum]|nr:hypothetical protein GQ600_27563 [Phytophthora cactorum]